MQAAPISKRSEWKHEWNQRNVYVKAASADAKAELCWYVPGRETGRRSRQNPGTHSLQHGCSLQWHGEGERTKLVVRASGRTIHLGVTDKGNEIHWDALRNLAEEINAATQLAFESHALGATAPSPAPSAAMEINAATLPTVEAGALGATVTTAAPSPAASAATSDGPCGPTGWTVSGWLGSLNLAAPIAAALGAIAAAGPTDLEALKSASLTRESVKAALNEAKLGGMVDVVWPALEELRSEGTAAEMHDKVG